MARYLATLFLLAVFLIAPSSLEAQDATPSPEPLLVGTVGLLAEDGSVFYSVLLGSGPANDLSDLTIISTLPEGATFVDTFWTPEAATFVGEDSSSITWTLSELPADTIIGPFTYQVTFDDPEAAIPANVAATVTWSEGEASAQLSEVELSAYDDAGSITVDEAGAEGIVPVENTGVYLLVPPGAFNQPVTFTFERQPISEESDLPSVPEGESIWWCTQFSVSVEPAGVEASQPVYILFPTRRTLTPGMDVITFMRPLEGSWEMWEGAQAAQVSPSGNYIIIPLTGAAPNPGSSFSAGVGTKPRTTATMTGVSGQGSKPGWIDPEIDPWIDPDINPNR